MLVLGQQRIRAYICAKNAAAEQVTVHQLSYADWWWFM